MRARTAAETLMSQCGWCGGGRSGPGTDVGLIGGGEVAGEMQKKVWGWGAFSWRNCCDEGFGLKGRHWS